MPPTTNDLSDLSVLAAFAHPDDEGFGVGGTLAMLASRGARITLVCATNGDVGEISDPALATPENLAQVRQEELRQAMTVTGISDVRFLNYRDSGMDGTADNSNPASLNQAPAGQVSAQLAEIIEEVRPRLVLTHDPTGGYGHPDHRAIHRHITQAFTQTINQSVGTGNELLYYVCFPRSNFRRMWQQMKDMGIEPPFASLDLEKIGSPDEAVTTVRDVTNYVDIKIASLDCHRTQMNPNGPFAQLPKPMLREIMSTEYFTLAQPENAGEGSDLLAGL
jgi:LmbE family N-acetylglucosaminyl deacetylase